MGTQQILLIVLSVILVAIAVAVGISMFNAQSLNSARQSIVSDMNYFASKAQTWYKTPISMGGGGYDVTLDPTVSIRSYIGIDINGNNAGGYTNDNGVFTVTGSAGSTIILFTIVPNESVLTPPQLKINVNSGGITVAHGAEPADPA
ncbi:MAG: hypothetical protein K8S23_13855 [Candidatus Cloacimonetes bacterium]|nr:hypothetical protein [Candidatus Cloacimonadota bacterium]